MTYELCLKLKQAGFPQEGGDQYIDEETLWDKTHQSDYKTPWSPARTTWVKCPTLSELVAECGEGFDSLIRGADSKWYALPEQFGVATRGSTPQEAVANLYLAARK